MTNKIVNSENHIIRLMAEYMRNRRFHCIPTVLFQKHKDLEEEHGEVMWQVGAARACPVCNSEEITFYVENDDGELEMYKETPDETHDMDEDDVSHWKCECGQESDHLYELVMIGAVHDWPCAHGYMYWTENWIDDDDFVQAAVNAGFLVYEHKDMNGYILGIDGGGYSFLDDHWIPLYRELGLTWHEQEREWPHVSEDTMKEQHVRIYVGPENEMFWMRKFAAVFGDTKVAAVDEYVVVYGLTAVQIAHELKNKAHVTTGMIEMVESSDATYHGPQGNFNTQG